MRTRWIFSIGSIACVCFILVVIVSRPTVQESSTPPTHNSRTMVSESHTSVDTWTHEDVNHNYSRMYCLGGHQQLNEQTMRAFGRKNGAFPAANNKFLRSCFFNNICFDPKQPSNVLFFEDPARIALIPQHLRADAVNNPAAIWGYWDQEFAIKVIAGAVPTNASFDMSAKWHLFDSNSFSNNWCHFMFDNVFSHFVALSTFFSLDSAAEQMRNSRLVLSPESECQVDPKPMFDKNGKSLGTWRDECRRKFSEWAPLLFKPSLDVLWLKNVSSTVCFRNVMVGQGSAYSLHGFIITLPEYIRRFRAHVLQSWNVSHSPSPPPPPSPQMMPIHIAVLVKTSLAERANFQNLCTDVQFWWANNSALFEGTFVLTCYESSDLSMRTMLEISQRATLLVTEHGTMSYMAAFMREGTKALVVYRSYLKEAQFLLRLGPTHVRVTTLNGAFWKRDHHVALLDSLWDHLKPSSKEALLEAGRKAKEEAERVEAERKAKEALPANNSKVTN